MPEPYMVDAGFPVSGIAEVTPFGDQEAGTSPDMLNLLPFDEHGRLRGRRRPGLTKFCPDQINGTNRVQSVANLSATYVKPVLGDGTVCMNGKNAATTDMSFRANDGSGTNTDVSLTHTFLGSTFGPDGKCYVVEYTATAVYLSRVQTNGTIDYTASIFTAGSAVSEKQLIGICADEDTIYVWYLDINNIGEGIMRLNQADGTSRDSTTGGVWVRAEGDATNAERVFGGVGMSSNTPYDVVETDSHSMMVTYLGYLICVGAPVLSTDVATNQLVVYIINTKTGIPDAVHDLGVDGTSTSNEKGVFIDLAIGLDGFIYVLYKDLDTVTAANTETYIRKISVDGTALWEIQHKATPTIYSLCWVPDRNVIAVCGSAVLGTGGTLALIDPDAKGIIDYDSPSSIADWNLVRSTADGDIVLWRNNATDTIHFYNSAFTKEWEADDPNTSQQRVSINAWYNAGTDEQGSTRYQVTTAISGGTLKKVDAAGATAVTGGASFSSSTRRIYEAVYGVLIFYADGVDHFYYDAVADEVKDWTADLTYGALPADMNGGFSYIEVWNQRIMAFGLSDDPNNYYFSAKGAPFDWKLQQNVAGAAINGTLSPAGRFPGKLVGAIPYNDDVLVMCGDSALWQMTNDPAVDGQFDLISDTIGLAPGRAWCKDGYGGVYFFANNGGIFKLGLDEPPTRISNRTIDRRFTNVDIANSDIELVWDTVRQGIWIFIRPHSNAVSTHYFFDIRTEGYFPVKFADKDYNPVAATILDEDMAKDTKILLANNDGYVRYIDDTVDLDDSNQYDRYFTLGPWLPQQRAGGDVMIREMDVILGTNSYLKAEVLTGDDPQSCLANSARFDTQCKPKRRNLSHPQSRGRAVAVKFSTRFDQDSEFEGVRMVMEDVRSI